MQPKTFETERFLLRTLNVDDVSVRYASWLNPETARMGIASANRKHSLQDLRDFIAARADRQDVLFLGIFTKDSGEHIGNLKYEPIDIESGYAVVGILIGQKDWWGKGVTVEVFRATARWLREVYRIREVVLGVMKDNLLARRSYEKVGFRISTSERIRIDPSIHEVMVWNFEETPP